MVQIYIKYCNNQNEMNEYLRIFQKEYPKRKIIGVSANSTDTVGWFMTITYDVNLT